MIVLRKVNRADCDLLFQWANDPECRKNSFSEDPIEYETHVRWFHKMLREFDCDLFVVEDEENPIGMLRLDYEQSCAIISYSVAREKRQKGYGKKILQLAEEYVKKNKERIDRMLGEVKEDNIGSQRAFEFLKYEKFKNQRCIEYRKILHM